MTSSPSPPTARPRRPVEALRLFLVGLIGQAAVACATAPTPASAAPPATSPSQAADGIGAIVRDEIAAGRVPGVVVVLGIGDKIVLRQAYGQRSVMPAVKPATVDTIYDAASLTKVMATSVAIMQLVERGQIDLDRPAAAYWPAFAANGKGDITVRQRLTHYAALPAGIPTRAWSGTEGALDAIVALKPLAPAGTRFAPAGPGCGSCRRAWGSASAPPGRPRSQPSETIPRRCPSPGPGPRPWSTHPVACGLDGPGCSVPAGQVLGRSPPC